MIEWIKKYLLFRCPMPLALRNWCFRKFGPKLTPYREWPEDAKARLRDEIRSWMKENPQ